MEKSKKIIKKKKVIEERSKRIRKTIHNCQENKESCYKPYGGKLGCQKR